MPFPLRICRVAAAVDGGVARAWSRPPLSPSGISRPLHLHSWSETPSPPPPPPPHPSLLNSFSWSKKALCRATSSPTLTPTPTPPRQPRASPALSALTPPTPPPPRQPRASPALSALTPPTPRQPRASPALSAWRPPYLLRPSPAFTRRFSIACEDFEEGEPPISVIHRGSRYLQERISVIDDFCIDEGDFHLNFNPKEYVRVNQMIELVQVPDTERYIYKVSDDGYCLLRSIPTFLNSLHESGCCVSPMTPLSLNNITISTQGKIRIRLDRVKIISLVNSEGGSVMSDYINAASVLKDLVSVAHGPFTVHHLPRDVRLWFEFMENSGGKKDAGYLICNRTCLLPMKNRADVFMKFYHQILTVLALEDQKAADHVLNVLPIRYEVGNGKDNYWHEIAAQNNAIKPWFSFRTYIKSRKELFNLHRNCYCHRESSPVNVDLVLYALYPDMLCVAQESLWSRGRLRELKVEENFSEKRSPVV